MPVQCGLGHHMELFGSQLVCHGATCKVKMVFLSPEVYSGAKLHNTGEVLRENSNELNNTLPIVPAVGKKRLETLSRAMGLSWRKGRAGWLEDRPCNHPSTHHPLILLPSSLLRGQLFPSSWGSSSDPRDCLSAAFNAGFHLETKKDMMNFCTYIAPMPHHVCAQLGQG